MDNFLDTVADKSILSAADYQNLLLLTQDHDEQVRISVAEALINASDTLADEILLILLKDEDELVRVNACESLFNAGYSALGALVGVMRNDCSELVRCYASVAIAENVVLYDYDRTEYIDTITHAAKVESSQHAKLFFGCSLYILGQRQHLADMLLSLTSEDYQVRCSAINLLGEIKDEENQEFLTRYVSLFKSLEKSKAVLSSLDNFLKC